MLVNKRHSWVFAVLALSLAFLPMLMGFAGAPCINGCCGDDCARHDDTPSGVAPMEPLSLVLGALGGVPSASSLPSRPSTLARLLTPALPSLNLTVAPLRI